MYVFFNLCRCVFIWNNFIATLKWSDVTQQVIGDSFPHELVATKPPVGHPTMWSKKWGNPPQNAWTKQFRFRNYRTICPEYSQNMLCVSSVAVVKLLVQQGSLVHILMLLVRWWLPMMICGRSHCWCLAVLAWIIANTVNGLGLFKWPTGREYHMIPSNRVIIWQGSLYDQAKHTIVLLYN